MGRRGRRTPIGLPERLLGSLERFVLVVGKGGVGKTTAAGALGVGLVDRGPPVHLVSTDPAHSLADLFDQRLAPGEATACACAPGLTLEEFDARAALREWREVAEEPIRELVERGTYLEPEDVAPFTGGSLPGADEFMAAVRLIELARGPARRVVVDTAPTGHAIRLLESGGVLRSWHAALEAMAGKATAVASALAGREVRLGARGFVDDLGQTADEFETLLRSSATCVVVSRPGEVVRAETDRLREWLLGRGLRVAAELRIESHGAETAPRGCDGLRRWMATWSRSAGGGSEVVVLAGQRSGARDGRPAEASGPVGPAEGKRPPTRLTTEERAELFLGGGRSTLLFVGKGGVGKTTCAAACAAWLARTRRVTLLGTDPAGSLEDVLGKPPPAPTEVGDGGSGVDRGLDLRQVDADAAFREFRERHRSSFESLAERVGLDRGLELDRRVLAALFEVAPPGLDELFGLAALAEEGRPGILVVDTSPTGHFLQLLEAPEVALEWLRALMRILVKYRSVTGLGDLAERLLAGSRRIRQLRRRLTDPERTVAFVVTLPEPMVLAETERLYGALAKAGIPLGGVILNRAGRRGPPARIGEDHPWSGAPVLVAPERPAPIVGVESAREFFLEWRRLE